MLFRKSVLFFLFSHLFLTKVYPALYRINIITTKGKPMSIDYNTIMTSSSEEVEEYINRNHFTDKQKLEIYSFITETEKIK